MNTKYLIRDADGRPKAVVSRPVPGAEEMEESAALALLQDRRAEKESRRPPAERLAELVRDDPRILLAMLSACLSVAPADPVLAAAKARIDPTPNRNKE